MEVIKYLNRVAIEKGHEGALEQLKDELGIKYTYNEEYHLYVLNYSQIDSPKTHPIVIECRSLVVDTIQVGDINIPEFEVVSRSFDRFLNLGENLNEKKIDITEMKAYEKLDGSLIGLFYHEGVWLYRTKSMIMPVEDMHIDAFGNSWKSLIESTLNLSRFEISANNDMVGCTFILELTSPFNRIVTCYKESIMTLLAIRDNNGTYLKEKVMSFCAELVGWVIPKSYSFSTINECKEVVANLPNLEEGYVLYNPDGIPTCKIKSPTYLAVHRIRGESIPTPKRIMDLVFTNEVDEYLTYFGEDIDLFKPYMDAFTLAEKDFDNSWAQIGHIEDQKEFALLIKGTPMMHLMFRKKQNNTLTFKDCFSNLTSQAKYNLTERYLG